MTPLGAKDTLSVASALVEKRSGGLESVGLRVTTAVGEDEGLIVGDVVGLEVTGTIDTESMMISTPSGAPEM